MSKFFKVIDYLTASMLIYRIFKSMLESRIIILGDHRSNKGRISLKIKAKTPKCSNIKVKYIMKLGSLYNFRQNTD